MAITASAGAEPDRVGRGQPDQPRPQSDICDICPSKVTIGMWRVCPRSACPPVPPVVSDRDELASLFGECRPSRDGDTFLTFLKEIHVVLDNPSTHTTSEVQAWLEKNPTVQFHFTPVGSSWINQIETWFGVITRQAIRLGTFSPYRSSSNGSTATSPTGTATPTRSSGPHGRDPCQGPVRIVRSESSSPGSRSCWTTTRSKANGIARH
jgi:hypothetical protein